MANSEHNAFDPASLSRFAASLAMLSPTEIRQTKLLYLSNAIDRYHAACEWNAMFRIWISIFRFAPLIAIVVNFMSGLTFAVIGFLIFSVFTGMMSRAIATAQNNYKKSIIRAMETWKDDLGDNYTELRAKLEQKPRRISIFDLIWQR